MKSPRRASVGARLSPWWRCARLSACIVAGLLGMAPALGAAPQVFTLALADIPQAAPLRTGPLDRLDPRAVRWAR